MLYTLVHALGTRSGCAYIRHVTAKSGEAIALPAAPLPTALNIDVWVCNIDVWVCNIDVWVCNIDV